MFPFSPLNCHFYDRTDIAESKKYNIVEMARIDGVCAQYLAYNATITYFDIWLMWCDWYNNNKKNIPHNAEWREVIWFDDEWCSIYY